MSIKRLIPRLAAYRKRLSDEVDERARRVADKLKSRSGG